jgi:hypothetical protein
MGWKKNPWNTNFGKKYDWSRLNFRIPMNKSLLLALILITVIGGLSYVNYINGNYIAILEKNKTNVENHLSECRNQTQSLSSELKTCNTNFGICKDTLLNKSMSLSICENEKMNLNISLSTCNDNLGICEDELHDFYLFLSERNLNDLGDLRMYINDLKDEKNDCENDLDTCSNDKYTLISNYAKDYCCLLNQSLGTITHYSISNNRITCGTTGTALTC